jgi:hypothetical protein
MLSEIKKPETSLAQHIVTIAETIDDVKTKADEQKEWLHKYFSKGKLGRKRMFYTYTWMGAPLY